MSYRIRIIQPNPGPLEPSGIVVSNLTPVSLTLTWVDNSNNEIGFQILQDGVEIDTVDAGVTTYNVTGLSIGTGYTFSVRSYKYNYSGYNNVAATTSSAYLYGYPAAGSSESNVSLQYTFTETDNQDLTDTVSSVVLARTEASQLTYRVQGSGAYSGHYGITFPDDNGSYFNKASETTQIEIPINVGLTFEWVAKYTGGDVYCTVIGDGKLIFYIKDTAYFYFETSAGTTAWQPVIGSTWRDGNIHKFRLTVSNRTGTNGTMTLFIDGVQIDTATGNGLKNSGTTTNTYFAFGPKGGALNQVHGTMYEFRYSTNATNNSGGPGGG